VPILPYSDTAIRHGDGVTCAVLTFEAIHAELISTFTNVVSLHANLEAIDIVIGSFLVKGEKEARQLPVINVFSVVTVG